MFQTIVTIHQIVMPLKYRDTVLSVAHDCVAGHMGVAKTLNRVSQHIYW